MGERSAHPKERKWIGEAQVPQIGGLGVGLWKSIIDMLWCS
jgi:hypothetical protein